MSNLTRNQNAVAISLEDMTNEQLVDRLRGVLRISADALSEAGAVVRILESRGYDLDSLRFGMLSFIRRIAYGQLMPEVLVRYQHNPGLVQVIGRLPMPDQEKLSVECRLPVLVVSDDCVTERMVDPLDMSSREVRQVFSADGIRNAAQQRSYLDDQSQRRNGVIVDGAVKFDGKRRWVEIGGVRCTQHQLLDYAQKLSG